MIPPFFTSFSSIGCTSTRSPSGLTLTAICFISSFWFLLGCAGDRFLQNAHRQIVFVTSSCPRQRLRIPHRQRRLRRVYQRLFRRRVVRQLHRVGVVAIDGVAHGGDGVFDGFLFVAGNFVTEFFQLLLALIREHVGVVLDLDRFLRLLVLVGMCFGFALHLLDFLFRK